MVFDRFCPKCGAGYDLSKKFCGRCGSKLSTNFENLSDEDLNEIVTEDLTIYSPDEIKAAVEELKKRDWEIGAVANLSDKELIEVTENSWNHPTSVLKLAYQQLEKRKIKIEKKIFDNGHNGRQRSGRKFVGKEL